MRFSVFCSRDEHDKKQIKIFIFFVTVFFIVCLMCDARTQTNYTTWSQFKITIKISKHVYVAGTLLYEMRFLPSYTNIIQFLWRTICWCRRETQNNNVQFSKVIKESQPPVCMYVYINVLFFLLLFGTIKSFMPYFYIICEPPIIALFNKINYNTFFIYVWCKYTSTHIFPFLYTHRFFFSWAALHISTKLLQFTFSKKVFARQSSLMRRVRIVLNSFCCLFSLHSFFCVRALSHCCRVGRNKML